jgi:hypothetical protein
MNFEPTFLLLGRAAVRQLAPRLSVAMLEQFVRHLQPLAPHVSTVLINPLLASDTVSVADSISLLHAGAALGDGTDSTTPVPAADLAELCVFLQLALHRARTEQVANGFAFLI